VIEALTRRGIAPALLAAVLAATGSFSAAADEGLTMDLEAGTNYEAVVVTPRGGEAFPGSTLTYVLSDPLRGLLYFRNQPLTEARTFSGLTAGASVAVDCYVIGDDAVTTNAAVHDMILLGSAHDDGWLYETPVTFTNGTGTGVWSGRQYATVTNDRIRIDTTATLTRTASVEYAVAPVPGSHRGFTIETEATFSSVCAEPPEVGDQRFGLTAVILNGDTNTLAFAYVDGGDWAIAPHDLCDPLSSTNWQVRITVDCDRQIATYHVRAREDGPWVTLGTASHVGAASVTAATFQGRGAITGLKGNGYDTQLLDVRLDFGLDNMVPGVNFEEVVVTGRVISTTLHPTDRTGGSYTIRLTDVTGRVLETEDYAFTPEGDMEFYVRAADLTPGAAYTAEVVLHAEAEANDANDYRTSVMGRQLTNENWGVRSQWVYENAKTFAGELPGTGDWVNREHSVATQDWIHVGVGLEGGGGDATVNPLGFLPTNVVEESSSAYSVSIRAVFNENTANLDDADGAFGLTVSLVDEELCFTCLSNRSWQAVSRAVAVPVLGMEYELSVYVRKDVQRLDYVIRDSAGVPHHLMTVDLDADLVPEFGRVDVIGIGRITDLSGCVYSTDLLRLHVDFSEDTLYPSTNFEATAANGTITFERLWKTDHTTGQLRVIVRDKYGAVVGQRRLSFHDLEDIDFQYYVKGLTPGETYTVDVVAEVKGIDSDTTDDSGLMARIVTNDVWATDGWIRENVETFAGRQLPGSGVWDVGDDLATEDTTNILINTTVSDDPNASVSFLATNALPRHTGFEMRSRLRFDTACLDVPTVAGDYGIAVLDLDPEGALAQSVYRFAVLSNGVWTVLGPESYDPELGTEYEVTVRVDRNRGLACYQVRSPQEKKPTVLAEFALDDPQAEVPTQTDFYGVGRVRTHEGDGFDVSLFEMSAEIDESVLTPGTNFASTVAQGVLKIRQLWLTDRNSGDYTVLVRDAHGNVVSSETFTYDQLTNQNFDVRFDGLEAGQVYDVEVVAENAGEIVETGLAWQVMARPIGGWIHETPATFAGEDVGTGRWLETNETAWVAGTDTGRTIRIEVGIGDRAVSYLPTNETLSVSKSTVREIRLDLDFGDVGWRASEDPPAVPTNALAAVTVWGDDLDGGEDVRETAIAVVGTNGEWTVVDETRRAGLREALCTAIILVDQQTGFVRYTFVEQAVTNRIHQYDFEPTGPQNLSLSFSGIGNVRAIDGDVWDPNLIGSGTNEFADLDTAIGETDRDEMLHPLWRADQLVTHGRGEFKVDDPENWLTVRFPWWYYVEITTNGSVRVFRFNQSNNWIDYAENGSDHIEITDGLFLVKTPEGLSWIAALATNEWVSGRIELAGDIDLSKHNWTPIAGFSGMFDGRGRTIRGLNNSYHSPGIPDGEYVYGPTNDWGRSAYGLFGTATNAFLADVTFTEVAISNLADSVATLAGALAGNCTVSNVTVESGSVEGWGGTAAGLVGFTDFNDFLRVVNNTNRADVTVASEGYGEGRWAAGLLCVAGPTDPAAPLGTVIVTNGANYGTVAGTLYDTDLLGGNLAEILAGTTPGARFGEVHLTNNLAQGSVDAFLVRSADNSLVVTNFPAVNLAPAFWGYDPDGTFLRALDANRPGAIAVDPVRKTARMLSGTFANGTINHAGLLNDEITASLPGSTVTMTEGFDSWGSIVLDRDLTFDLGGFKIYTVYVNNTFVISNGVAVTIRNGTIAVGPESRPFVGGDVGQPGTENLTIEPVPEDFYKRTVVEVNGEPISALWLNDSDLAAILNMSGTVIALYDEAEIEIDVDSGKLKIGDAVVARLNDCYGFRVVPGENGAMYFEVRIADSAAPTVEFVKTGGEAGTVRVKVGNVQSGFWYALQYKETLDSEWMTPPAAEWVRADSGGAVLESTASGSQGYYRVLMTDNPSGLGGD